MPCAFCIRGGGILLGEGDYEFEGCAPRFRFAVKTTAELQSKLTLGGPPHPVISSCY